MPTPVSRSSLGIGKEVTAGTAVAASFTLPVTSMTPVEKITRLYDDAWRASMAKTHGAQSGPQVFDYDFAGDLYADAIGWPVVGLLGDDAVTGAAAPYTHAATLLNSGTGQPTTYTLIDNNALEGVSYAGFMFSDLDLKFTPAGLITYTAKGVGRSWASGAVPTPSYTTLPPSAAWRVTASISGSAAPTMLDGEVMVKRTVTDLHTLNNSQAPYTVFAAGDLECSGKATLIWEATTYRDYYRTGTQVAIDLSFTQGTGAAQTGLTVHSSVCDLKKADVTRGKTYVELAVEWDAIANTTDAGSSGGDSPVKITLINALASGTYK